MKKNESGRSMVEMLGVLALMGILSVGGITSFRYVMNHYQANKILEEAKMHSALISGQALMQEIPESVLLNSLSYAFTYRKESTVAYSLGVEGIDKNVCKILQGQRQLGWAERLLINDGADCKDSNQIQFYINTGMTTETTNENRVVSCMEDVDCGECGRCGQEQKLCIFDDFYCTDTDKPYCNRGTCHKCPVGQMLTRSNICRSCTDDIQWFDMNGVPNKSAECALCPNRSYNGSGQGGCHLPCPEGKYFVSDGHCYDTCTGMFGKLTYGSERAQNDCLSCGGVINSSNNICLNCQSSQQTFRTHYCSRCKNRVEIANGRYPFCALPCGAGKTLYIGTGNDFGVCADCSTEEDLNITGVPEGYRCTCDGERYIDGNYCKKCPTDISGLTLEQREQCTSNETHP